MTPHSLFSENRRLLSTKSSSISPWNTATAAVFSFIKWWLNRQQHLCWFTKQLLSKWHTSSRLFHLLFSQTLADDLASNLPEKEGKEKILPVIHSFIYPTFQLHISLSVPTPPLRGREDPVSVSRTNIPTCQSSWSQTFSFCFHCLTRIFTVSASNGSFSTASNT